MPTLFIRLLSPATHDEEGIHLSSAWMIVEDDGSERAKGEADLRGLSELIDPSSQWLHKPDNIVVIVPSEHVLAVSCEVPGRSIGQIRRALPFVVEEFVATEIEGLHLANDVIRKGKPIRCNLIETTLLDDWLECFVTLGLNPGHLVSEAELLPSGPEQVSLLFDGDVVLLKTESQSAIVDRANLVLALGTIQAKKILSINGELQDLERGQLDEELTVETVGSETDSALRYFAHRWFEDNNAINLLQGVYVANHPADPNVARWRAVAALLLVWLLVGFTGLTVEGFWAGIKADSLREEGETLFLDIVPGTPRITNIRRQLQRLLGVRSADDEPGFGEYMTALAEVLGSDISVLSVNYTDARRELDAELTIGNYEELDRLKTRFAERNMDLEVVAAEQTESGVGARVRLRGL